MPPKLASKNTLVKFKKKEVKTILTKRGYSIIKQYFTLQELESLKKALTVKPYVNEDYGAGPEPYPIYLESAKKLYIPKHIGFKEYGEPDQVKLSRGFEIDLSFKGSLRDKQQPIVKAFLDSCKEGPFTNNSKGGIISVPCGWGKTIMALYLISILKRKTIVIVHKEFLLNQWIKRIEEFLPDARVGILQANKVQVEQKDIVIGMLQSLSSKDYDIDKVFGEFGFVIVDECHHIAAEVFSRSLPKVNSYYSLGLSATPKRADGMSHVFESFLGPMVYKVGKRDDKLVRVNVIRYDDDNEAYSKEELSAYGKVCIPRLINNIAGNVSRNILIKCILKNLVQEGRQTLVLSDRRNHLKELYTLASEFTTVGYYVGGMKQSELDKSETKSVILGTYPMSSEGLDIPTLDAVIFTTPKSSIEQSIGRITRKQHINTPVAYDIVDNFCLFPRQFDKRLRVYKKLEYDVYELPIQVRQHTTESDMDDQLKEPYTQIPLKKSKKKTTNVPIELCEIHSDG
jgi:superfamily II DNA or RNA helicase